MNQLTALASSSFDFLFEIVCEEIPATLQSAARIQLQELIRKHISPIVLADHHPYDTFISSRHMALRLNGARYHPQCNQQGPLVSLGLAALEGFCRKYSISSTECVQEETSKGLVWSALLPQEPVEKVLEHFCRMILKDFFWPRRMRWYSKNTWVRPIRRLICLYNTQPLIWDWDDVTSGAVSEAHPLWIARTENPQPIFIKDPAAYEDTLRACEVIVSRHERADMMKKSTKIALRKLPLYYSRTPYPESREPRPPEHASDEQKWDYLDPSPALLEENLGLAQYPTAVLGRFDGKYLELPPEVITTTIGHHQKCFHVRAKTDIDPKGLYFSPDASSYFVAILDGNFEEEAKANITKGVERVINARLSDALFFWKQDLALTLEQHGQKLKNRTFFQGLGSLYDKAERCEESIIKAPLLDSLPVDLSIEPMGVTLASQAGEIRSSIKINRLLDKEREITLLRRAAVCSKADLATSLVEEFPELQGTIAKRIAILYPDDLPLGEEPGQKIESVRQSMLPNALEEYQNYWKSPYHHGEEINPIAIRLAIVDGLDTLVGFFALGLAPTGSSDKFALRRTCHNVIQAMVRGALNYKWNFSLAELIHNALAAYHKQNLLLDAASEVLITQLTAFFKERCSHLFEYGIGGRSLDQTSSAPCQEYHMPRTRLLAMLNQIEHDQVGRWIQSLWNLQKISSEPLGPKFLQLLERARNLYASLPEGSMSAVSDTPQEQCLRQLLESQSTEKKGGASWEKDSEVIWVEPLEDFLDHVKVDDPEFLGSRRELLGQILGHFSEILDYMNP